MEKRILLPFVFDGQSWQCILPRLILTLICSPSLLAPLQLILVFPFRLSLAQALIWGLIRTPVEYGALFGRDIYNPGEW